MSIVSTQQGMQTQMVLNPAKKKLLNFFHNMMTSGEELHWPFVKYKRTFLVDYFVTVLYYLLIASVITLQSCQILPRVSCLGFQI